MDSGICFAKFDTAYSVIIACWSVLSCPGGRRLTFVNPMHLRCGSTGGSGCSMYLIRNPLYCVNCICR